MNSVPPKAREAMELARQGDLSRAIASGEEAVRDAPGDGGLRLFIGMLHARQMDFDGAAAHLRAAAALMGGHPLPRIELARVLIAAGRLDEAEAEIAAARAAGQSAELIRLEALLHQRRGAYAKAVPLLRAALARDNRDFESWGHLGTCLRALGDADGAIAALDRAVALRPDQYALRLKLAETRADAGQAEAGLAEARVAAPNDAIAGVIAARFEDLLGRPAAAWTALENALAIDPDCQPALVALADLAERDNRVDLLKTLLGRIEAGDARPPEAALLRARLLLREGDARAALAAARSAPDSFDPSARARIIGEANDRLGDADAAFAAFTEMNRQTGAEVAGAATIGRPYREKFAVRTAMTTPDWYRSWPGADAPSGRPAPIFLFGFPRSGTTLLDTMLAGDPSVLVLEETPVLNQAAEALGDPARLPHLDRGEVAALRDAYFAAMDAAAPEARDRRVIDKVPLGIVETALAHRLFPDARFIFVERHPCDVVLSGFMTRFDPRGGMANFLNLEDLAQLYDGVLTYWQRCREVFPLAVHTVRYERLIADPEGELKPLVAFLGLDWDARLLDHQASARRRAFIGTPSYAQVAEPIYAHASGRWKRYRDHLAPVLPVLAPWAAEMGYAM